MRPTREIEVVKLGILETNKFYFSHSAFSKVYFVCFKQVLIFLFFTPNNDMSIKFGECNHKVVQCRPKCQQNKDLEISS